MKEIIDNALISVKEKLLLPFAIVLTKEDNNTFLTEMKEFIAIVKDKEIDIATINKYKDCQLMVLTKEDIDKGVVSFVAGLPQYIRKPYNRTDMLYAKYFDIKGLTEIKFSNIPI